jgi:hypothetical protein
VKQKPELKWSAALVKTRISDEAFTSQMPLSPEHKQAINDIKFICGGVFESKERIEKISKKLRGIKKGSVEPISTVVKNVLDELAEIASDLAFAESRHGKFILFANDWSQELYKTIRIKNCFANILSCSHPEKEILVLQGTVSTLVELTELIEVIKSMQPGVPIEFRVIVTN